MSGITLRTIRIGALALALFQVSAFSARSQDNKSQENKADDQPVVVKMTDQPPMKFSPDRVTVKVGQVVEWFNGTDMDGPSHNVTNDPNKVMDPAHVSSPKGAETFDSGTIKPGKSFTHKFTVPGVYDYACSPHEGSMRGEVVVQP